MVLKPNYLWPKQLHTFFTDFIWNFVAHEDMGWFIWNVVELVKTSLLPTGPSSYAATLPLVFCLGIMWTNILWPLVTKTITLFTHTHTHTHIPLNHYDGIFSSNVCFTNRLCFIGWIIERQKIEHVCTLGGGNSCHVFICIMYQVEGKVTLPIIINMSFFKPIVMKHKVATS